LQVIRICTIQDAVKELIMPDPVRPMDSDHRAGPGRPDISPTGTPRRLRSADLFQGSIEIVIDHGADQYRLRRTSSGKLILTK